MSKNREKVELTRDEIKVKIRERKIKRAFRIMRFRSFKNFLFWLTGAMMSFVIFFLTIFVGVGVIPIETFVGKDGNKYISNDISSKSIYQALMSLDTYDFADFPILEQSLKDLLNNEISTDEKTGEKTKLSDVLIVDYAKLNSIKISGDVSRDISSCFSFNVDGVQKLLGGDGQFEAFSSYTEVEKPVINENFKTNGNNFDLYFYAIEQNGNSPLSLTQRAKEVVYKRAFDDNGVLVPELRQSYENEQVKLYFAPLFSYPISKAMSCIDSYLPLVAITDILGIFEIDGGDVLAQALTGVKLGDLSKDPEHGGVSADVLLGNLTFENISSGDGSDVLGALGNFTFFGEYVKVAMQDKPELDGNKTIIKEVVDGKEQFTAQPKMFYVMVKRGQGDTPSEYARAFNDDGVLNTTYFDKDGNVIYTINDYSLETLYYANLLKVPVVDALNLMGDCIKREQIVELFSAFEVDLTDSVFFKLLEGKTIGQMGDLDGEQLINGVSLETLGLTKSLGNLGKLDCFTMWQEVLSKPQMVNGTIAKENGKFIVNPKLYYYLADNDAIEEIDKYAPAFNEDGSFVDGVTESTTLYFAKLSVIGFSDMANLLGDSIMQQSAVELFKQFGMQLSDDSLIKDILDGKTVKELADISEDDIQFISVLSFEENVETYKIILSAMGKTWNVGQTEQQTNDNIKKLAQKLTIGSLKDIDSDNIALSVVMELDQKTAQILCSGINGNRAQKALDDKNYVKPDDVTISTIKVGDMKDFDSNYILLNTVIPNVDTSFKTVIEDLLGGKTYNLVTVKDLSVNMSMTNIKLSTVLPIVDEVDGVKKDNTMLYKMLLDAKGIYNEDTFTIDAKKLTLEDISGVEIANVKLALVMPEITEDSLIYDILDQAFSEKGGFNKVTIADLKNFEVGGVKVYTVLKDLKKGDMLYDILDQAYGDYESVQISQLSSLSLENVMLETVLPRQDEFGNAINVELYSILEGAVEDKDGDGVDIGELSTLSTAKIKLSNLMEFNEENSMFYKIVIESYGKTWTEHSLPMLAQNMTVGDIRFDMNKVKLETVIGNSSTNAILCALIEDGVCVGEIGTALDNLNLYEAYGKNVFVKETIVNAPRYNFNASTRTFTLDDNGEYYLNKDAGIWLLLCFERSEEISTSAKDMGRPLSYVISNATMKDLQGGSSSFSVGEAIREATVRQLIDAGLIESANQQMYALKLADVLKLEFSTGK